MTALTKGRYRVFFAETTEDVRRAQRLRYKAFLSDTGTVGSLDGLDQDLFDDHCQHVLVEDRETGALKCCFRVLPLSTGSEIHTSYSAQYYELSALGEFDGPMIEVGRFCIDPEVSDPDILRVAWGALAKYVDENNIEMLFGCSSFQGTDEQAYADSFAVLRDRHIAPKRWLPRVKAPKVFQFAKKLRRKPDVKQALRLMPPLLKSYLMMGGWVSDHAVVDRHMNTLHVFTGLEVRTIPPARKRLLRSVAG